MSGGRHRKKGARIEREIVERHKALGFDAERYPLSGASGSAAAGTTLICICSVARRSAAK